MLSGSISKEIEEHKILHCYYSFLMVLETYVLGTKVISTESGFETSPAAESVVKWNCGREYLCIVVLFGLMPVPGH